MWEYVCACLSVSLCVCRLYIKHQGGKFGVCSSVHVHTDGHQLLLLPHSRNVSPVGLVPWENESKARLFGLRD